jgi:hypothetical protein
MSGLSNLSDQFPYARYHAGWNLVTWHPNGVLDNERADHVVDFLESEEKTDARPFHRFTDMNGYTRIKIGLDHIVRIARRRRRYAGPPVKSAFYAKRPVSVLIARMYEELMDQSLIEVSTFRDLSAAADWLGVPVTILQPPPGYSLEISGKPPPTR